MGEITYMDMQCMLIELIATEIVNNYYGETNGH